MFELKNIPGVHNIHALFVLLLRLSKTWVQQQARNIYCPKVVQGVLCPVNTLQLQKYCSWADVFQTWFLLEKETCLGFLGVCFVLGFLFVWRFLGWCGLCVFFFFALGFFCGFFVVFNKLGL